MPTLPPISEQFQKEVERIERKKHPNFGSKFATPTSMRVDFHYIKMDLYRRWTWERYKRLANFLALTPYELASIVAIPHVAVERWERFKEIPMSQTQGAWTAALVLTVLEHQVLKDWVNDTIENPFPDLKTEDALPENPS